MSFVVHVLVHRYSRYRYCAKAAFTVASTTAPLLWGGHVRGTGDSTDSGHVRGKGGSVHGTALGPSAPPRESVLVRRTSYRSVGGLVTNPNLNTSYMV